MHRIGRTGRAQAVGDAFTLVTPDNAGDIRDIERFIGQKIPQLKLEGFDYKPLAGRPPQDPSAARGGQRRGSRQGYQPRGQGHHQGGGSGSSRSEPRRDDRSGQGKSTPHGTAGTEAQPRGFADRGTPEQRRRSFWRR